MSVWDPVRAALVSVVGLVAGCDTDLYTERGQIRLESENVFGTFVSGNGIAEQSIVCVDDGLEPGDLLEDFEGDGDLTACYDERIVGPVSVDDDGCLVFDTPGIVDLEFDRRQCAVDGNFGDDRLRFEVLAFSELRGAFEYAVPIDATLFERYDLFFEDPSSTPEWLAEVGDPIFVIEDLFESVATRAVRSDRPEEVAVTSPYTAATAVAGSPALQVSRGSSTSLDLDAKAGDVIHVMLSLPAGTLDVGDVHVVARSEAVELVLAPSVFRAATEDEFLGLGAEAVARDREGRILREPPVWWSVVQGDIELDPRDDNDDGFQDPSPWISVADDECDRVPAGTWRSAILAGQMDGLRETVELHWECIEGAGSGCLCSVDDRRAAPLGAMLVLLLARRRASRAANRSRSERRGARTLA